MRTLIGLCALLLLAGCATNTSTFSETQTAGPGGQILTNTAFQTKVAATAGSRISDGAGSMDYQGKDWRLKVGGAASGLEASGDPVMLLNQLLQAMTLMAPYLQRPPAPPDEPDARDRLEDMVLDEIEMRLPATRIPR